MPVTIKEIKSTSTKEEDKISLEKYTNSTREGYALYGDRELFLPINFKDAYQKILDFDVRDDDTFVVTFPKSGTTWCQEMVWLIRNELNYAKASKLIQERYTFIEYEGMFTKTELNAYKGDRAFKSVQTCANTPSPRFIKTHMPWEFLPLQVQKGLTKPKIVYCSRNPKDVLVSNYFHCKLFEPYTGNFDEFFKLFMAGRVNFSPYWPHILEYWKRRDDDNILFLHYEDMKADLPGAIRKAAKFLGKQLSEEEVAKLAEHLSFEKMKDNNAVNYRVLKDSNKKFGISNNDGEFMRSGKVGDYKQHMSKDQIDLMDKWTEDALKGSDFKPFKP